MNIRIIVIPLSWGSLDLENIHFLTKFAQKLRW